MAITVVNTNQNRMHIVWNINNRFIIVYELIIQEVDCFNDDKLKKLYNITVLTKLQIHENHFMSFNFKSYVICLPLRQNHAFDHIASSFMAL